MGESPEIFVADAPALTQRFVSDFTTEGRRALGNRPAFSIALPGGSVATTFFPSLARANFDWSRTEIFWADERIVPFSDPESNYGASLPLLLRPAGIAAERIHRMPVEDVDVGAAAAAYSTELRRVTGDPPRLDFVLLGVGRHDRALDDQRPVAIVDGAPKAPKRRMTLTMPVLRGADRIVIAAFGASKREALSDALSQRNSTMPLAIVMREKARVLLLLDPEAA